MKNVFIYRFFSKKRVSKEYELFLQLVLVTILTIASIGISGNIYAQEETDPFKFPSAKTNGVACGTVPSETEISSPIDDSPEYPGGIAAMKTFLQENIIYPSDSIEGKVYISAIVNSKGIVTSVKIKKSLSPLADAEVIRVAKLLVFKPALVNGKPVNSTFSLPVNFSREKKK